MALLDHLARLVRKVPPEWSVPRAVVARQARLERKAPVPSKAKGDPQAPEVSQEKLAKLAEMAKQASVARRVREVHKEPVVPVASKEVKASVCQVLSAVLVGVASQV